MNIPRKNTDNISFLDQMFQHNGCQRDPSEYILGYKIPFFITTASHHNFFFLSFNSNNIDYQTKSFTVINPHSNINHKKMNIHTNHLYFLSFLVAYKPSLESLDEIELKFLLGPSPCINSARLFSFRSHFQNLTSKNIPTDISYIESNYKPTIFNTLLLPLSFKR